MNLTHHSYRISVTGTLYLYFSSIEGEFPQLRKVVLEPEYGTATVLVPVVYMKRALELEKNRGRKRGADYIHSNTLARVGCIASIRSQCRASGMRR